VEPASWVVAIVFGLGIGLYCGRRRQDLRAVQAILVLAVAIGTGAWIANPSDLAGPSLVVGGGAGLVATFVAARRVGT
jgi:hypothetical protein